MKNRIGFVSNSSTASFIILGFKMNYDDEEYKKMTDEERDAFWEREDVVTDSSWYYVGNTLAKDNNGYLENVEFTAEELQQMTVALAKKHGVEIDRIKLFMGTRAC